MQAVEYQAFGPFEEEKFRKVAGVAGAACAAVCKGPRPPDYFTLRGLRAVFGECPSRFWPRFRPTLRQS
eukprot:6470176-Lingulodinium_polyedra.AAC.1